MYFLLCETIDKYLYQQQHKILSLSHLSQKKTLYFHKQINLNRWILSININNNLHKNLNREYDKIILRNKDNPDVYQKLQQQKGFLNFLYKLKTLHIQNIQLIFFSMWIFTIFLTFFLFLFKNKTISPFYFFLIMTMINILFYMKNIV